MAGSIQRAVKLDERRGCENTGSCPVVLSDKQQRADGANANAHRKATLQQEALQRLQRRRATEGSAGGFLDRQDASDKRAYDSDEEEFDDFGRRKKRRKDGTPFVKKKREAVPEAVEHPAEPSSSAHRSLPQDSEAMDGERLEGTVRWYESSKGFGFVRTQGIDHDIYFKDQDRTLAPVEGMRCTFILKVTPDGKRQARSVMRGTLAEAQYAQSKLPAEDASQRLAMQSSGSIPMTNEEMMMQAQLMIHMQMMNAGHSDV